MNETREFESLEAFLENDQAGFVILHQEKASGNDFRDKEDLATPKLLDRFAFYLEHLGERIGNPDQEAWGWKPGIPAFASGGGYVLWNGEESFVSLFISWDNPEDPSFVILARAPLEKFDSSPEAGDPWGSLWMKRGEW